MVQEQERGITITSAATACTWRDTRINIIDTPGHVDFTVEVERSLRVLDGLVALFDSVAAVQPQSETVWRQANKYKVRASSSSTRWTAWAPTSSTCVEKIRERLGARAVPIQVPIGAEDKFLGVVDLFTMKKVIYTDDLGSTMATSRKTPTANCATRREVAPGSDRGDRRARRRAARDVLRRQRDAGRSHEDGVAQGDDRRHRAADAVRFGIQEQGRAAVARRRRRLFALAARSQGDCRQGSKTGDEITRKPDDSEPFARSRSRSRPIRTAT